MSWQLHTFPNNTGLCTDLGNEIISVLQSAIEERGRATLAVSGGYTPLPLFQQLSKASMDWSKVVITLVDERWLAPEHEDSNARLVNTVLRVNEASESQFLPLWNGDASPYIAEEETHQRLASLHWPLDVIVLGMGNDGHTASLFPGSASLSNALQGLNSKSQLSLCCAVSPENALHQRMTLTLPAILDCRQLYLQIRGDEKLRVLEKASVSGEVEELPMRAVMEQAQRIHIYSTPN